MDAKSNSHFAQIGEHRFAVRLDYLALLVIEGLVLSNEGHHNLFIRDWVGVDFDFCLHLLGVLCLPQPCDPDEAEELEHDDLWRVSVGSASSRCQGREGLRSNRVLLPCDILFFFQGLEQAH